MPPRQYPPPFLPPLPPPVFLNKDVRDSLKKEGSPTLPGTLGFILMVTLAVIVAHSLFVGPYWYTIVAVVLFVSIAGFLFWKMTEDGGGS